MMQEQGAQHAARRLDSEPSSRWTDLLNSTRSTVHHAEDKANHAFRDTTLELAKDCPFARR